MGLEWNLFTKLAANSPPPQDSTALLHEFNQVKEEYRENIIFCSKIIPRRSTPECVLKWRKLLLKLLDAPVVTTGEDAAAGTGTFTFLSLKVSAIDPTQLSNGPVIYLIFQLKK
jgi:hypothetical protein